MAGKQKEWEYHTLTWSVTVKTQNDRDAALERPQLTCAANHMRLTSKDPKHPESTFSTSSATTRKLKSAPKGSCSQAALTRSPSSYTCCKKGNARYGYDESGLGSTPSSEAQPEATQADVIDSAR